MNLIVLQLSGSTHDSDGNKIYAVIRVTTVLPRLSLEDFFCHFKSTNATYRKIHPSNRITVPFSYYCLVSLHCPLMALDERPVEVGISYRTTRPPNSFVLIRQEITAKY